MAATLRQRGDTPAAAAYSFVGVQSSQSRVGAHQAQSPVAVQRECRVFSAQGTPCPTQCGCEYRSAVGQGKRRNVMPHYMGYFGKFATPSPFTSSFFDSGRPAPVQIAPDPLHPVYRATTAGKSSFLPWRKLGEGRGV